MTWRTVIITKHCKLSYKHDYLIIRDDKIEMIHLSEINTIVVDSTMVSLTSYLVCELMKQKIKLIFCDEKRNPCCEVLPYYGRHNSSKMIQKQILWKKTMKKKVWTEIIKQKIANQAKLLQKIENKSASILEKYLVDVKLYDPSNREGHAAKVYFNSLFGTEINRSDEDDINVALNYGYAILLSNFNKEIVSNGYLTQVGFKHKNEYNSFNLASDIMEPFRILIDEIVYHNKNERFSGAYKVKLQDILNKQVVIRGQTYYLSNAITIYVKSIFDALDTNNLEVIQFFDFQ